MTVKPICENVETVEGVPLTVNGVAQVKIMREEKFLNEAATLFLGLSEEEIKDAIEKTLEGHLRLFNHMYSVFPRIPLSLYFAYFPNQIHCYCHKQQSIVVDHHPPPQDELF